MILCSLLKIKGLFSSIKADDFLDTEKKNSNKIVNYLLLVNLTKKHKINETKYN